MITKENLWEMKKKETVMANALKTVNDTLQYQKRILESLPEENTPIGKRTKEMYEKTIQMNNLISKLQMLEQQNSQILKKIIKLSDE